MRVDPPDETLRRQLDRHQKDPRGEPETQTKEWPRSAIHLQEDQMAAMVAEHMKVDWRWKEEPVGEGEEEKKTAW
jgi:hypothetical protein